MPLGTNRLVGRDAQKVRQAVAQIMAGDWPRGERPPGWDGHAGRRIAEIWSRR